MRSRFGRQEELFGMHEKKTRRQGGFALILAVLALMLLTFLGLTLTATTSTELQIATNFRWSQQAYYNAEAGIEAGKSLLRTIDWAAVLPTARGGTWNPASFASPGSKPTMAYTRPDAAGNASRNAERGPCDTFGNGAGYGAVLDDGGANAPYQNVTTIFGQTLNGTFTLWVRRRATANADGTFQDDSTNDALVLTAEGSAPYRRESVGTALAANRAIQVLEVTLQRSLSQVCGVRGGQVGGAGEGSGFSACDPITGAGVAGVLGFAVNDTGAR